MFKNPAHILYYREKMVSKKVFFVLASFIIMTSVFSVAVSAQERQTDFSKFILSLWNKISHALSGKELAGNAIIDGCDPEAGICGPACNDLFLGINEGWSYDEAYWPSPSCFSDSGSYSVLSDEACNNGYGSSNQPGQCAYSPDGFCPSFERNGGPATFDLCGSSLFNYNHIFFSSATPAPSESCKTEKTSQLAILSSITLANKGDANKLKEAVKALDKSLNEEKKAKWKAECELYCPYEVSPKADSKKVFYNEEKTVQKLMEIKTFNQQIKDAIVKITDVDKLLAQKALDANPACNTVKATKEMTAADSDYSAKKYKDAISHYKKAWESSMQCRCKNIKHNIACDNYLETAETLLEQGKVTEAAAYENKYYSCIGLPL